MTPPGIEPTTFRFVAQCINKYQNDSRKKFNTFTFYILGNEVFRNSDDNNVKGLSVAHVFSHGQ
jgi:hypothetical protein